VAVYLVQREVADRMAAAPGSKIYGALSVNLQAFVDVRFVRAVGPGSFHPPPAVDSAIVRVVPRATPLVDPALEAAFRTFVIGAFGLRRKQMGRVLRTLRGLSPEAAEALLHEAGVRPDVRPEVLPPETFADIVRRLEASRTA
jgi:16S rRNA (adenine1518-N6/adenine1519-N6)-dimethyltransferase